MAVPHWDPPEASIEEQQQEEASEYTDKFYNLGKPSFFNIHAMTMFAPVFSEELYRQSRIHSRRQKKEADAHTKTKFPGNS
jgi:hypothetical protein